MYVFIINSNVLYYFHTGLFIPEKESTVSGQGGLFKTGQFYLLGVQVLSIVTIIIWTLIFATLSLKVNKSSVYFKSSNLLSIQHRVGDHICDSFHSVPIEMQANHSMMMLLSYI